MGMGLSYGLVNSGFYTSSFADMYCHGMEGTPGIGAAW